MRHRLAKFLAAHVSIVALLLLSSIPVKAERELEFWVPSAGVYTVAENLVHEFEHANPGVKVNVVRISWNDFASKVPVAYAAGQGPDVLLAGAAFVYDMVSLNFATPLDRWTRDWDALNDYAPGVLDGMTYEGKLYGLPAMAAARTLWYRKDIFAEHGLDPDTPPESWQDIRSSARRIVRFDGDLITRIGFHFTNDIVWHAFLTNGVDWFTEDLSASAIRTPEGLEALTFWSEFGREMQHVGQQVALSGTNIFSGSVGMVYGTINPNQMSQIDPGLFEVIGGPGVMENRVKGAFVYPDWVLISSQAKDPDLAWEFLKWISSPGFLKEVSATVGHPAPRRAAYDDPYYTTREGNFVTRLFQQAVLPHGVRYPVIPDRVGIGAIRRTAWNRLLDREWSPEAALEWMDFEINNIAKRISERR